MRVWGKILPGEEIFFWTDEQFGFRTRYDNCKGLSEKIEANIQTLDASHNGAKVIVDIARVIFDYKLYFLH